MFASKQTYLAVFPAPSIPPRTQGLDASTYDSVVYSREDLQWVDDVAIERFSDPWTVRWLTIREFRESDKHSEFYV